MSNAKVTDSQRLLIQLFLCNKGVLTTERIQQSLSKIFEVTGEGMKTPQHSTFHQEHAPHCHSTRGEECFHDVQRHQLPPWRRAQDGRRSGRVPGPQNITWHYITIQHNTAQYTTIHHNTSLYINTSQYTSLYITMQQWIITIQHSTYITITHNASPQYINHHQFRSLERSTGLS